MNNETNLLSRISRELWTLIIAYAAIGAILLMLVSPLEFQHRVLVGPGLGVALALILRFWNVSQSLAAIRSLKQDFGISRVDTQSPWAIARDLLAEKYVSELRETRDSKRTVLAWSVEYGARLVALFAILYLLLVGWKLVESGFEALQTPQFLDATRVYLISALVIGPVFFIYLLVGELLRRRKR